MRILWIPKSSSEFSTCPELAFYGSNRLRVLNIHEQVQLQDVCDSDVLGLTVPLDASISGYDIVVIQKNMDRKHRAFVTKYFRNTLVVFDACDPIALRKAVLMNLLVDLVICSNHQLQDDMRAKGLVVSSETVMDPHEADPLYIRKHHEASRPIVTWYGIAENYPNLVRPLIPMLQQEKIDFRWASSEEPSFFEEPGFQKGVKWNMCRNDAWVNPQSWQKFIQQSDIGIVPVTDVVKSAHKLLNYMAYGIPVVCSPTDAHKRIVKHGFNGFFASNEDEWKMYLEILRNPEVRRTMGVRARESVFVTHSVECLGELYIKTLLKHHDRKAGGRS